MVLARNFGKDESVIRRIREELGLAENQEPGAATTLLSRKVVARVVKMIDEDIWTNCRRTDDGKGVFDLATLKSRSDNMDFESVRRDKLGLETSDAVSTHRRATFIGSTVAAALKDLEGVDEYSSMSPEARQALKFVLDEVVQLWTNAELSDTLKRGFASTDPNNADRATAKKVLTNLVRVNFVRALIIFGQADDARSYVRKHAETADAWKTFEPLNRRASRKNDLCQPGLRRALLLELNRLNKYKRPELGKQRFLTCCEPGSTLRDPMYDNAVDDTRSKEEILFHTLNYRRGDAIGNLPHLNKKGNAYWNDDLQRRQDLWNRVDALPKGFLPKSAVNKIKKQIQKADGIFTPESVEAALDLLQGISQDDLKVFADRLANVYRKASGRQDVPPKLVGNLLERLKAAVFAGNLLPHQGGLTLEACVRWFEENPTALLQLDRQLNLPQDEASLNGSIKDIIAERFVQNDAPEKFVGSDKGVYLLSVREYDDGGLTVDGEHIPTVPSPKLGDLQIQGVTGRGASIRHAFVETLQNKIADVNQRKLVSFLLSMADGVANGVDKASCLRGGIKNHVGVNEAFGGNGLLVTDNQNRRLGDLKIDDNGNVHLKMTVGTGLQIQMLVGTGLPLDVPLVNDCYEVEITIPKPGPDFKDGCPAFTVDAIRFSNVDLLP